MSITAPNTHQQTTVDNELKQQLNVTADSAESILDNLEELAAGTGSLFPRTQTNQASMSKLDGQLNHLNEGAIASTSEELSEKSKKEEKMANTSKRRFFPRTRTLSTGGSTAIDLRAKPSDLQQQKAIREKAQQQEQQQQNNEFNEEAVLEQQHEERYKAGDHSGSGLAASGGLAAGLAQSNKPLTKHSNEKNAKAAGKPKPEKKRRSKESSTSVKKRGVQGWIRVIRKFWAKQPKK